MTSAELSRWCNVARRKLEQSFSATTVVPGTEEEPSWAAYSAAVALVVNSSLGGELLYVVRESPRHNLSNHWFNRVRVSGVSYDVDLTLDDVLGWRATAVGVPGELHYGAAVGLVSDLARGTRERAEKLRKAAGIEPPRAISPRAISPRSIRHDCEGVAKAAAEYGGDKLPGNVGHVMSGPFGLGVVDFPLDCLRPKAGDERYIPLASYCPYCGDYIAFHKEITA